MTKLNYRAPLSTAHFALRLLKHGIIAFLLLAFSLGLGMVGYVHFEHLSWIDAFLNASMLLGGMGPVNTPRTVPGKLYAGFYALYAGLVFIVAAAVVLTPVLQRILHRFHRQTMKSDTVGPTDLVR